MAHSVILLDLNGTADLWLQDVKRFADGSVKSGYVVNGGWAFHRVGRACKAMDGRFTVTTWQRDYVEVPRPDGTDYNEVIQDAREKYFGTPIDQGSARPEAQADDRDAARAVPAV